MKNIFIVVLSVFFQFATGTLQGQQIVVPCEEVLSGVGIKQLYPAENSHSGPGQFEQLPENPNVNVVPPGPPPPQQFGDERLISWIHGLGGSDGTWAIASEEIENVFKTIQDRPFYLQPDWEESKANLFQDAREGSELAVTIHNLDPTRSFAIGHSMGGLMSRNLQLDIEGNPIPQSQNPFNGIITVGTPHLGAPIVDNFDDLGHFILDGVEKVSVAYVYEAFQNSFAGKSIVEGLISHFTDVDLDDPWSIIGSATNLSNPEFFGMFWDAVLEMKNPGVTPDLSPNSEHIANLQSYENNLPSIAMYGIEDDPAILRFLSKDPLADQPWSNNADDEWVLKVDEIAMELWESTVYYNELYQDYVDESCGFIGWILNPPGCAIIEVQEAWENWDEGNLYLGSAFFGAAYSWIISIDDQWKLFTGVAEIKEELNYWACHCEILDQYGNVVDNAYFPVNNAIDCYIDNSDENCSESPVIRYYFEQIDEYDAVVPAQSAMAFPNVGAIKLLESSNHGQMKNNSQFKFQLYTAFNSNNNEFFKTELR